MSRLYKDFVNETLNSEGIVEKVTFKEDKFYNFAYDVVDRLAAEKPEKVAMVWCNEAGNEKLSPLRNEGYSDKTASFFQAWNKKGDAVMLILGAIMNGGIV